MKMNNKYLSGLLAGVLTAGVVQGSGKGKMNGLGREQTPVVNAQTANELPAELQNHLLELSQVLTGLGYQAQINLSSIQMPRQITSFNTLTLNGNNGVQSNINEFNFSETKKFPGPKRSHTPAESRPLTIGENGETKEAVVKGQSGKEKQATKQAKLDPYHMQIVQQHMGYVKNKEGKSGSVEDLKNLMQVSKKFSDQYERNRINTIPVTEANKALFDYIETQQIFGPNDYIKPDMYQYIIVYPATKAEIENWVARLQDMHTDKALTPIVFEYQLLPDLWYKSADQLRNEIVIETEDFKIKQYYTDSLTEGYCFRKGYYRFPWLDCFKKPIVFEKVTNICVENEFDLFVEKGDHTNFDPEKHIIKEYEIGIWVNSIQTTYSRYKNFIQRYPVIQYPEVEKVSFIKVEIDGKEINEQKRQLRELSEDKKVKEIGIKSKQELKKSPELLGNVKVSYIYGNLVINRQSFGKSRIIIFARSWGITIPVGIKVYAFKDFQQDNNVVSEAVKKYVQYVNDNNLGYLSCFVNFANKPSYLTDEEWRKVIVLTGMVEELMNLVDQKFDEYEANPNAVPANGNNYGCDGYGCNPYRQYFYGYGC